MNIVESPARFVAPEVIARFAAIVGGGGPPPPPPRQGQGGKRCEGGHPAGPATPRPVNRDASIETITSNEYLR
jgi:hypothetical protein